MMKNKLNSIEVTKSDHSHNLFRWKNIVFSYQTELGVNEAEEENFLQTTVNVHLPALRNAR
jgi:hypothetical protein